MSQEPRKVMSDNSDYLTGEEIKRLLDSFKDNYRNYLIFRILALTGMRISELVGSPPTEYALPGLFVEDIDWQNTQLTILGKKKRPRLVDIDRTTLELLRKYLLANGIQKGRIFNINRKSVWRIMKNKVRTLGLKTRKLKDGFPHPHSIRHTFFIAGLEAGASPGYLAQNGGNSLTAMMYYIGLKGPARKEEHAKLRKTLDF